MKHDFTCILNYEKMQNDTADDTAERQQTIHKQECKELKELKNNTKTLQVLTKELPLLEEKPTPKKDSRVRDIITYWITVIKEQHYEDAPKIEPADARLVKLALQRHSFERVKGLCKYYIDKGFLLPDGNIAIQKYKLRFALCKYAVTEYLEKGAWKYDGE